MKTKPFIFKSGMTGKKQDSDVEYTTLNLYQIDEKKETKERYLAYAKRNKNVASGDGKKNYNNIKEDENLFFMYAPVEIPLVKNLFFGDIILVSYDVSDSGAFELIDIEGIIAHSQYKDFDFSTYSGGEKIHPALKYRESLKEHDQESGSRQEQIDLENVSKEVKSKKAS